MSRFNQEAEFVGIVVLKQKQKQQLQKFKQWVEEGRWSEFHSNHYDWWMFPVDQKSSYGYQWTVAQTNINQLKQDADYMSNYQKGVELLAASWGWDLLKQEMIINPEQAQCWHQWPVRLYKATYSTKLFGIDDYFLSLRKFALILIEQGKNMSYRDYDFQAFFLEPVEMISKRDYLLKTARLIFCRSAFQLR